MKIVIVGAGAIGRIFGVYLSRQNHSVIFIEKKEEVVEAINHQGLGFMAYGAEEMGEVVYTPAEAVSDAKLVEQCNFILLTVKSFDTLSAIRPVEHLISEQSPLLSLQTGLGNLETMEKVVGPESIIGGFTFMAGTSLDPGVVRHGGSGKTYIGELDGTESERTRMISTTLTECGLECELCQRIIGRLWCKVIIYSAINPLSSILRVKNGQLLENMESIELMKRLVDEGINVAQAHSIDLVYPNLYELLFDSCNNTRDNLSSMLQDIINGNRTEIEALNETITRYGDEKGISTSTHKTVTELVKLMVGQACTLNP